MGGKSILFLCDDAREIGGVQRVLATLAQSFRDRGYSVSILSLADRAQGGLVDTDIEMGALFRENALHRLLQRLSIGPLHLRGRRLFRVRPLAYRRALRTLRKHAERTDPAAIIVFDTLMANIAARSGLAGRKVIVQFHNSFESLAGERGLSSLRDVSQRVSAFVALTEADAVQFREAGFKRCSALPNPVSFYPESVPVERERRVIALGRFHHQKAFEVLVGAWAQVERPAGWTLDIYGEGVEQATIEDAVQRHDVADSVTLHPPTRMVEALLSRAAVFALSSRYEGLCMVLLEALACGLPIASTRSGPGTAELVDGCGLLSDIGDEAGLAANLQTLINDPALRAQFSTAGRAKARQYDVNHVTSRWERLIDAVEPVS